MKRSGKANPIHSKRLGWAIFPILLAGTLVWAGSLAITSQVRNPAHAQALHIHYLQGSGHLTPLDGQEVQAVEGIITAVRSNGFYMQDLHPDGSESSSEGIFVYLGSRPSLQVGEVVSVTGMVQEYYPGGISSGGLSTTEIAAVIEDVDLLASGVPLPPAVVIGSAGRLPPAQTIEDDASSGNVETSGVFDPQQDGIDFFESLEGMWVQVDGARVVGPTTSAGEITVIGDDGNYAGIRTARGGLVVQPDDFNPERILLDDVLVSSEPKVQVGDRFDAPIRGVMDYSAGNFKLLNSSALPGMLPGGLISETAAATISGYISIATFNVYTSNRVAGASSSTAWQRRSWSACTRRTSWCCRRFKTTAERWTMALWMPA